jgi:peptide-methionine (S)-S-oxide reductase
MRQRHTRLIVTFALLGFVAAASESVAAKGAHKKMEKAQAQKATFAAGCFWGVEAAFRQIKGVLSTQVGYTGGRTANPSYEDVCSEKTGHAEAVEVTYDPSRVPYDALLNVFWQNHDPTTPNRQGPDVGEQYRSAIFYHSPAQEKEARASKARLEAERRFKRPIVTQIVEAGAFHRAEEYHQQYLEKRGLSVCHIK